jgi:hypothetical protein
LDNFFDELDKTKEVMDWTILNGLIRAKKRGADIYFCPLSAVNYCVQQSYLDSSCFYTIMHNLNLNAKTAELIFTAADNILTYKETTVIRERLEKTLFGAYTNVKS